MSTIRAEAPFALIARYTVVEAFTLVVAMRANIEVAIAAMEDFGASVARIIAEASALFTPLSEDWLEFLVIGHVDNCVTVTIFVLQFTFT